jgi:hypothetical protein
MPVSVEAGPDVGNAPLEQERVVTVLLEPALMHPQEFAVSYEVQNSKGEIVDDRVVVKPRSPRRVQVSPTGGPLTQFTFRVYATKATGGERHTVRVIVSYLSESKSSSPFEARSDH